MSKRPCPFEPHCPPQRKVHISEEDANRQNDAYMKEVYQKTVDRLFQGANNNNNVPVSRAQPLQQVGCLVCKTNNPISASCWFCEINMCRSCVKICNFCCENFCSRCTVSIKLDDGFGLVCNGVKARNIPWDCSWMVTGCRNGRRNPVLL